MFTNPYHEGFYKMAVMYLGYYKNGIIDLDILNRTIVPKEILSTLYEIMVAEKKLMSLESLPIEQKQAWWDESKKYSVGLKRTDQIKVAKSIYCLSKLAEL